MGRFGRVLYNEFVSDPAQNGSQFVMWRLRDTPWDDYAFKVQKYTQYVKAKKAAKHTLERLEREVLFELPPEILEQVLACLSRTVYPGRNHFNGHAGICDAAFAMLRHLPVFQTNGDRKPAQIPNEEASTTILKMACACILENCTIAPKTLDFITSSHNLTYRPTAFALQRTSLCHLHLTIDTPKNNESISTSQLHVVSTNLDLVKTWYPNLKSLSIEIQLQIDRKPYWTLFSQPTMHSAWWKQLKEEMEALVTSMRSLAIRECYIWAEPSIFTARKRQKLPRTTLCDRREAPASVIGHKLLVRPSEELWV